MAISPRSQRVLCDRVEFTASDIESITRYMAGIGELDAFPYEEQRYMYCFDCKMSEPIGDDFDFGAWIAKHPLHSCGMSDQPQGQVSLF